MNFVTDPESLLHVKTTMWTDMMSRLVNDTFRIP